MLAITKIKGDSMAPTIQSGDFVFSTCLFFKLSPGDLIIANHPVYNKIIKRIKAIDEQGFIMLEGDSPSSTSSEDMGLISPQKITGKVLWIIHPR